jgi:hypothetical protein
MAVQILFRRGTSTEWTSANPTLGAGEPGIETNTGKIKVGDGSTLWNVLPYAAGLESLRLQDLSNVASTAPSTGQVLKWNGTAWAPAADETGGEGADGNTTYGISAETATGGVDLRLTGSDASTDNVKLAAGANVTVTRTDASTITIAATGTGEGASNLDDLGDVVITGTPTTGQVLKFDGTNWVNGTDATSEGGGASTLDGLTDVVITGPVTNGQVLKYDSGTSSWVNGTDATVVDTNTTYSLSATEVSGGANIALTGSDVTTDNLKLIAGSNVTITRTDVDTITIAASGGGGGALPSRAELTGTSSSLNDGQTGPINITGYKAYALLKVETSAAAWVRIYTSEAARIADASRTEGVDPAPGVGVIAEVITTGAETVTISPGTIGFNDDLIVSTAVPVRVTNKSGASAAITVTLTALQLEA